MNRKLLVLASLVAILPAQVRAQAVEVTWPTEPILRRAPDRSEWMIFLRTDRQNIKEEASKSGQALGPQGKVAPSEVKSRSVSKDGNVYREVVEYGDGQTREKWIDGDMQVYETRVSKKIARAVAPDANQISSSYSDYRRSDFENLEWVSKDNFQGVKDFNGRKVFEFTTDPAKRKLTAREMTEFVDMDGNKTREQLMKDREDRLNGAPAYTAYLDAQTQLPVYFDDGEVVRIYKFVENPSGKLVAPPPFAVELARWKKQKSMPQ